MLLIYAVISSLFAVAALFTAGYLYGLNKVQSILLVDGKRHLRRTLREKYVVTNKLFERSGLGSLNRRPAPVDTNKPPTRVITSPAQVINDLKAELSTGVPKVPPSIKQSFLEDAGSSLSN